MDDLLPITLEDLKTPLADKVLATLDARRAQLLDELANPNIGFEATQVMRGRLAEAKRLADLIRAPLTEPRQGADLRAAPRRYSDDSFV